MGTDFLYRKLINMDTILDKTILLSSTMDKVLNKKKNVNELFFAKVMRQYDKFAFFFLLVITSTTTRILRLEENVNIYGYHSLQSQRTNTGSSYYINKCKYCTIEKKFLNVILTLKILKNILQFVNNK